jgi:hypothetical protein
MRIAIITMMILLGLVSATTRQAVAQVRRAAIGTAVGIGGGAVITMSAIVARAKFQNEYLESPNDLIHWQSVPMILTPAVGMMFGLAGNKPLRQSIVGSTSGMVVGAAVGAGIGWMISGQAEAPWAGGVIGSGVGMTIGGLFLGTRAWLRTRDTENASIENPEEARIGIRIPL